MKPNQTSQSTVFTDSLIILTVSSVVSDRFSRVRLVSDVAKSKDLAIIVYFLHITLFTFFIFLLIFY